MNIPEDSILTSDEQQTVNLHNYVSYLRGTWCSLYREPKQQNCHFWYHESVLNSVIAKVRNSRSHLQSNLYSFYQGSGFCLY